MAKKLSADEKFMHIAIQKTRSGIIDGQTPFGAAIAKNGRLVCASHNVVWDTMDITAHGEVNAIRIACRRLGTINLSDCTLYSTCEPCPMCFSAIHWAKIKRIVYGASISDAKQAGFHEIEISNAQMKKMGRSRISLRGGVLREECKSLFTLFRKFKGKKKLY